MALVINKPIKMVLFDVDGVMTDGTIYMAESGEFIKAFNVKDGLAIELLRAHGIKSGVISGKASPALTKRCQQLGFDVIETGCKHKLPKLEEICHFFNVTADEIAFCGDDVLDLPIMAHCGMAVAPADAHPLVLAEACWVSEYCGGFGMVRDFVDHLLLRQSSLSLKDIYQPLLTKIAYDDLEGVEQ
ncbi:3-deoxy-D-manno-octulosonate 8-phosphate phosphatase KdsC [Vibrio chagasii]|nr:3-deoxy-D-manno-octulosonate 8-phosphate phosphatase KdsC [Vibrio chagasii]CAH7236999.1 3-deoxy-D-manno-octulosonate 8-phosphate phosphatase KdsC [Vibrio chagasii]CAH7238135.1 3-deoxy-D-manno-octulosonate 8-phosphate phosphatase KdsC [Vibrio chagasii]CAH7436749.1 3-deoxy-D-manno-octulosonate 8-phosphate phosphatase KdsC [Vibrio chagasii]